MTDLTEKQKLEESSFIINMESLLPHLIIQKIEPAVNGKVMRLFTFDGKGFTQHENGLYLYLNEYEAQKVKDYINKYF